MDNIVECAVCLEDMVEPRSLPCGHTFCKTCLQKIMDEAFNIQCPIDRRMFNVPQGNAENLARNYLLENMLENLIINRGPVTVACVEHADKQAKFFCESCVTSICSKCILKHNAHKCFLYSESQNTCEQRVQELRKNVEEFKKAIDGEKIAKFSAAEAQVAACKRKVDEAKLKICEIVKVLYEAAEAMENLSEKCKQIIHDAFKLSNLESLQLHVAELSHASLGLTDASNSNKLEWKFMEVDHLNMKLEVQKSKLETEVVPEVSNWFSDSQLTKSLDSLMDSSKRLKQSLTSDTKDFFSLQQLTAALQKVNTTTKPKAPPSTMQGKSLPTAAPAPAVKQFTEKMWSFIKPGKNANSQNSMMKHKHLLIVTGGLNNASTFAYDTTTDSWRQVAALPSAHYGTAATVWNGKVVVAGGWQSKSVEQYDPETNMWTALPEMQQLRHWLGLACFDNSLFAIGGHNGTEHLDSVEQYNLQTKQWILAARLNAARSGLCGVVIQKGILVVGGGSDQSNAMNTCELFDGTTRTWKYVAPLLLARCEAAAATLNDKVYVFGGCDDNEQSFDSVEEYDCAADKWTLLNVELSVPRHELAAATVNGRIYICGGLANLGVVESFNASEMRMSNLAPLPALAGAAAVCVPVSEDMFKQLFEGP